MVRRNQWYMSSILRQIRAPSSGLSSYHCSSRTRRRSDGSACPNAEGERTYRCVHCFAKRFGPLSQADRVSENFAAQSVIAIENARLLNELRERTDEVEKLNQQLEQRVADQVGEIEHMAVLAVSASAGG